MQRFDLRFWRSGDHATNFCGGRKEGGGFAAHHPQIHILRGAQVLGSGHLQHLALGNGGGGVGQDIHHPQRPGFDHQLKRAGKQIVAHQHRGFVIPQQVGGRAAPALRRFVYNIIMEQGGRVNEFNRCRQMDVKRAAIAAHSGGGQR